jgi:cold-inducible RNA-binding protein
MDRSFTKMEMQLFVGNLSHETTEDDLRSMFTQVGTVVEVELMKDRDTGRPMEYAYVTMSSQDEVTKAIYVFNGRSLDNRGLKVNAVRTRESDYNSDQVSKYQSNRSRNQSGGNKRE